MSAIVNLSNLAGTYEVSFSVGAKGKRAALDASGLTTDKTVTLQDAAGTLALTSDSRFTDARPTAITDDTTTDATMYLTWVTAATGNLSGKVSSTKLTFNPSTGTLSSTVFVGALTGNVSGSSGSCTGNAATATTAAACSGNAATATTAGACTGNAATVTTNADLTGPITSAGNATAIASQTGTGTTFVMQAGPTITGVLRSDAHYGTLTTDADASTITFDMAVSNLHTVTLAASRILAVTNVAVGQTFSIRLVQGGSGSNLVTWFTTLKWPGGVVPTLTTTVGKTDVFVFTCTSSGNYDACLAMPNL